MRGASGREERNNGKIWECFPRSQRSTAGQKDATIGGEGVQRSSWPRRLPEAFWGEAVGIVFKPTTGIKGPSYIYRIQMDYLLLHARCEYVHVLRRAAC